MLCKLISNQANLQRLQFRINHKMVTEIGIMFKIGKGDLRLLSFPYKEEETICHQMQKCRTVQQLCMNFTNL